jgi:hypothetical protein
VPKRQPKRGRLWLNDGSCIRLRPCWPHHVRAYDCVEDPTHDGRKFRMLTVIDGIPASARRSRLPGICALTMSWIGLPTCSSSTAHRTYPFAQRRRVHRHRGARVAAGVGDAVHRAWQSLGERRQRVVQTASYETSCSREIFYTFDGGPGADRALAPALQSASAAQLAWVSSAGAGDHHPREGRSGLRYSGAMARSARPPIAHGINITSGTQTGGRADVAT